MDVEIFIEFIEELLLQKSPPEGLKDTEKEVLRWSWEGLKYKEMAAKSFKSEYVLRGTGSQLWKRIADLFDIPQEQVTKKTFKNHAIRHWKLQQAVGSNKLCSGFAPVQASIRESEFVGKELGSYVCKKHQGDEAVNPVLITETSRLNARSALSPSPTEREVTEFTSSERREMYQKALELVKAAGSVGCRADFRLILKALNIYKQLEDFEQAASLIIKPIDTPWQWQEQTGAIAYRLGFLVELGFVSSWLIDEIEIGEYLPTNIISQLHNINGDLIWMACNDTLQAIYFHQNSQKYAYRSQDMRLIMFSEFNQALCNIDRGDMQEARKNIIRGYELSDILPDVRHYSPLGLDCLSAYIESLMNKKQAVELVNKTYSALSSEEQYNRETTSWAKNNLPVYVAKALQNIGSYREAFEMYMKADGYAKASGCIQVQAQVLIGKATLCYLEDRNFMIAKSITWLLDAKRKLERISAEGDQAHVNLLLGVMFRELGKTQKSQRLFQDAEDFYLARNAPQKVIRLNQIREGDNLT